MEFVVFPVDLQRGFVLQSLMGPVVVVLHLPELQLVFSLLRILESHLGEQIVVVGPVRAFNKPVFPGFASFNQGVNPPAVFDRFCKGGFTLRVGRVLHRETHRVVGEGYEKGGSASKLRSKTPAMVLLS